ncbi:hypothetical protein [Gloeobacter morelensis]|uniref:Uncharacterized protein n=1 Tax=Gloeobacter morelensis MG652769 TaxID=2781736 RepID=A0ABY3PGD0_9CYAN|nr:hypothetical protein [Gloeobacter morelensis]UFP92716.1 hypothetical protein ISF26_12800 [Gloeobacter morelensis MG652769]
MSKTVLTFSPSNGGGGVMVPMPITYCLKARKYFVLLSTVLICVLTGPAVALAQEASRPDAVKFFVESAERIEGEDSASQSSFVAAWGAEKQIVVNVSLGKDKQISVEIYPAKKDVSMHSFSPQTGESVKITESDVLQLRQLASSLSSKIDRKSLLSDYFRTAIFLLSNSPKDIYIRDSAGR